MNKLLIVIAHPNNTGHNRYFLENVCKTLEDKEISFEIIDLYKINYNPCLNLDNLYTVGNIKINDINKEIQEKIRNYERLLFIYPTWWQNMPAIMKGFFDNVFTPNFAYKYLKNGLPLALLKNKRAAIFTSTGGPKIYTKFFLFNPSIKSLKKHILSFSGIKSKGFILYSAKNLEDNKQKIETISNKVIKYLMQ